MIAGRRIVGRLGPAGVVVAPASRFRAPLARLGRLVPLRAATRAAVAEAAGRDRVDEIAGLKVSLAVAGIAAALTLARPPVAFAAAPLFAAAGWRWPHLSLQRRAREREELVRAALPDALDLLSACALAGMGIDQALRTVTRETTGVLGEALSEMVRGLDAGMPREAAYETLVRIAPSPDVRSLVRALRRAERYGTPVAPVLVAQAREVRGRRRAAAEEAARAAPVRMLFPLVLCFLPAFVLLTVAPIVLTALRSFKEP